MHLTERLSKLSPEQKENLTRSLRTAPGGARFECALPPLRVDPARRFDPFPLNDVQEAYCIGTSGVFDLGGTQAHVFSRFHLRDESDSVLNRLDSAVRSLIDRHDMLRAIVLPGLRQRVLPEAPRYEIEVADFRAYSSAVQSRMLTELIGQIRGRRTVEGQWPLFTICACRYSENEYDLLTRLDCRLVDGVSRAVLMNELFAFFDDPREHKSQAECTFRDFVVWLRELRSTEVYRRSRAFWIGQPIWPSPPIPLISTDAAAPMTSRDVRFLDRDHWAAFTRNCISRNLTTASALTTAFAALLSGWSSSTKFTFSVEGTFRPPIHPDMERFVGNCNTIYLLPVEITSASFAAHALEIQREILEAIAHQYYSGFEVVRHANKRWRSRSPMPIMFNAMTSEDVVFRPPPSRATGPEEVGLRRVSPLEESVNLPNLRIIVTMYDRGELVARLHTADGCFYPGMLGRFWDGYAEMLNGLSECQFKWDEPILSLLPASLRSHRAESGSPRARVTTNPKADAVDEKIAAEVSNIWREILSVAPPSPDSDFFELGGDSLQVFELFESISRRYGARIDPEDFYESPTVRTLVNTITRAAHPQNQPSPQLIDRERR
jgi:acyl carrier protein